MTAYLKTVGKNEIHQQNLTTKVMNSIKLKSQVWLVLPLIEISIQILKKRTKKCP